MTSEPATTMYSLADHYERALKLVRAALVKEGLEVPLELDVSGRIRRELGIALAPCRVLCVDCPFLLLEAVTLDAAAAVFLPLHVVVSAHGSQTFVHLLSPASTQDHALPVGLKVPISKLHARVSRVLERMGVRQAPYQLTA